MTKLAALQKVLQSDFLASVREVYEHVYETVDIQGSQVRSMFVADLCSIYVLPIGCARVGHS